MKSKTICRKCHRIKSTNNARYCAACADSLYAKPPRRAAPEPEAVEEPPEAPETVEDPPEEPLEPSVAPTEPPEEPPTDPVGEPPTEPVRGDGSTL